MARIAAFIAGLLAVVIAGCATDARLAPSKGVACVPPADDGASLDRLTWDMSWREARDVLARQGLCIAEHEHGKARIQWFTARAARWWAVVYFDDAGAEDRSRRHTMNQITVNGEGSPSPGEGERVLERLTGRFGAAPDVKVVVDGAWENAKTRLYVEHKRRYERWVLQEEWMSPTNGPICRAPSGPGFRDIGGFRRVPWHTGYEATRQALSGDPDVRLGARLDRLNTNGCGEEVWVGANVKGAEAELKFSTCHDRPFGLDYVAVFVDDPVTNAPAPPAAPEDSLRPYVSAYGPPCRTTRHAFHRWKDATTDAEVTVSSWSSEGAWSVFQVLRPLRAPKR